MKVAWISTASVLLLAWASASLAAEPGGPLPPFPGADVTASTCTHCHTAEVIAKRGRTPDEWRHTVDVMIRFGARMNDEDKQQIVNYLIQAFPPKPKPQPTGGGTPE